jgi:hypothetical protein
MACRLSSQDFYSDSDAFKQKVERVVEALEQDPEWSQYLTPALRAAGHKALFVLVTMYEMSTGRVIFLTSDGEALPEYEMH